MLFVYCGFLIFILPWQLENGKSLLKWENSIVIIESN